MVDVLDGNERSIVPQGIDDLARSAGDASHVQMTPLNNTPARVRMSLPYGRSLAGD